MEEFVREKAQTAYHKELANLLLGANVPSVNVHSISRSPVACEVDEQWRAVKPAFDRLCSMHVDAMSARIEQDATYFALTPFTVAFEPNVLKLSGVHVRACARVHVCA